MSLDSVIARARKRQAVQFTDTATVSRPVGEPTFDSGTGTSTQTYETRYSGLPCKVKTSSQVGYDVSAAETSVRLIHREAEFDLEHQGQPVSFAEDDVITITASTYNEIGPGDQFRVTDVDRRTWQVCRRVSVEETSVPKLWEGA